MKTMDMIGNLLSAERKKKGLEIIDVEHATGIRAMYLLALEEGRYTTLPGDVYVKGFIRNYGNYLGLDGAHLVHLYTDSLQSEPVVATATVAAKVESSRKKSTKKHIISTVIIVLLLAISAWSLYLWQKSSPGATVRSKPETTVVKPTSPSGLPAGQTTPLVGTPASSQPATISANRPITLSARFTDRCWTSVIADGKSIYEGIPQNNEMFTWQADRQIVVNFGNAAAVELTFNGQPVGKIGERGDVVVKTFSLQPPTAPTPPAPAAAVVKP